MEKIVITRPMIGICHMGVCAESSCTDDEILAYANLHNPAGTSNGWSHIIREDEPSSDLWPIDRLRPVPCRDYANRVHLILVC